MRQFLSDNAAAVHPRVMEALVAANQLDSPYDGDALSQRLGLDAAQVKQRPVGLGVKGLKNLARPFAGLGLIANLRREQLLQQHQGLPAEHHTAQIKHHVLAHECTFFQTDTTETPRPGKLRASTWPMRQSRSTSGETTNTGPNSVVKVSSTKLPR